MITVVLRARLTRNLSIKNVIQEMIFVCTYVLKQTYVLIYFGKKMTQLGRNAFRDSHIRVD